jgi:hypothetical protein
MKKAMIGVALLLLGAGGGLFYVTQKRAQTQNTNAAPTPSAVAAGMCTAHGVPKGDCPWCDESLIEKKGQCGGHGVPEAFCSRCNASLIPGFKAVGDWCGGHNLPESQCAKCKGGDLPPGERPATGQHNTGADGAFCGMHQIAEAECPWCDTSLIKKKGQCGGHGVPEALCSRCNAALIPGFKAEKDWCAGHGLPESQCAKCKGGDLPPGERPAKDGSK